MKMLRIWLAIPMMMIAWGAYAQDDNISNNEGSEVVDVNKSDAKAEKKAEKAVRKVEKDAEKAARKAEKDAERAARKAARKAAKAQSDAEWKSRQSYGSSQPNFGSSSSFGGEFYRGSSTPSGSFCGYSGGTFNTRSK